MNCTCNVTLFNTGRPNCDKLRDITKHIWWTPTYADDGTRNRIDLTATLNQAFFDGLLNQSDGSKRIYPLRDLVNVTDVRSESEKESLTDGSSVRIRQGIKTFNGAFLKHSHNYLDKLQQAACVPISAYIVDKSGNLIGSGKTSGYLTPIRINQETIDILMDGEPNDAAVSKLLANWEWDSEEEDRNIRMIEASSFVSYDILDSKGLIDLSYLEAPTVASATAFTIKLKTDFGSLLNPLMQTGFSTVELEIYNNTTASVITPTSITENGTGIYDVVIPAQTTSDKVVVRLKSGILGFDDTNFETVEITML